MVKAQHILIQTKPDDKPEGIATAQAKADAVYKELLAGGNFAKLAEKYSDDGETKSKGGDLGLFTSDQMVPEFSQPVFAMKKDELGKPFKTPFGFHIVMVNDYIPPKQLSFKEVAATIRSRLQNERQEAAVSKELERLKKKYKVRITAPVVEKK
jgi:parvulin-like peptidyl-prolyl isomerase